MSHGKRHALAAQYNHFNWDCPFAKHESNGPVRMQQSAGKADRIRPRVSQTPQLSILIVNWNGRQMLRNLLASIDSNKGDLLVQTIVLDNASSDGSADMVASEFHSVVLQRNTRNVGFARGNNQAARAASAPLILLLNNDTRVRPRSLHILVQFMDEHPMIAAAGPKLIGADGKPQHSGRNLPTLPALLNSIEFLKWTGLFHAAYLRYRREGFDPTKPGTIGQLAAAALIIRRSAFEQCGGFDENFAFGVEDVDLCHRLSRVGDIFYIPKSEIEHLGRVSSRANRNFVYRTYECGWARYLGKHHGHAASLLYKILVTLDLPVRLLGLSIQCGFQRMLSRREKFDRSLSRLKATANFAATGLPAFWTS
jgi:N-acetylglucosaminyl-diphospho-decaprenol L-rhamnosyltransferase